MTMETVNTVTDRVVLLIKYKHENAVGGCTCILAQCSDLRLGGAFWGLILILRTMVNNMQEELLLFILCYVSMQILARMLGRSCKSMNLMCCWVFMVALGSLAPSAFWRVVCFGRKCCFLLSCWAQVWLLVMVSSHLQSLVWMMTSAWNDFQSLLTKRFPY